MVLLKKSNELLIFQYLAVSLVIFGLLVCFPELKFVFIAVKWESALG
jgi:hypothetical protein